MYICFLRSALLPCGPVKIKPIFKDRLWGSDRLKDLYLKDLPKKKRIGESWELADLPQDKSIILEGFCPGIDIRAFLNTHGLAFGFTAEQISPPFGLLIKLLDANDVLSVQVHPDARACEKFPDARLKTECWYVLDAGPGAVIYRGLRSGVTRQDLIQALDAGSLEQLLQVHPAHPGDFHFIPAGTIHALGAGIIVAEIQTPSDTTYRLYDWQRRDCKGQPRQLHIEQALASINFNETNNDNIPKNQPHSLLQPAIDNGTIERLIDCPYFSVARMSVEGSGLRSFSCSSPVVVMVLDGNGTVADENIPEGLLQYHKGDTLLLPKTSAIEFEVQKPGSFLLACLGPLKA
jgi:mannose-6-phosphate isomerase